jgi:hypothetical protein
MHRNKPIGFRRAARFSRTAREIGLAAAVADCELLELIAACLLMTFTVPRYAA